MTECHVRPSAWMLLRSSIAFTGWGSPVEVGRPGRDRRVRGGSSIGRCRGDGPSFGTRPQVDCLHESGSPVERRRSVRGLVQVSRQPSSGRAVRPLVLAEFLTLVVSVEPEASLALVATELRDPAGPECGCGRLGAPTGSGSPKSAEFAAPPDVRTPSVRRPRPAATVRSGLGGPGGAARLGGLRRPGLSEAEPVRGRGVEEGWPGSAAVVVSLGSQASAGGARRERTRREL